MGEKSDANKLRNLQDSYLKKSFKYGKDDQESEVIDILSDYAWNAEDVIAGGSAINLNGSSTGASQKTNIPFCYVAERRSAANAGIANIFNVLYASGQSIEKLVDLFSNNDTNKKDDDEGVISNIAKELEEFAKAKSPEFQKLLAENNLSDSTILTPYKYLYITKATKKKFVFPILNNTSSFTEINNIWGSSEKLPGIIQLAMDSLYDMADSLSIGTNLVESGKSLLEGKSR